MPTKTFLNLNKEKQDLIIKEAIKEFSNKLYSEVSLNQIIKKSKISRGSFYMYFNDKRDLYLYIMDKFINDFDKLLINKLKSNNRDLFTTFLNLINIFDSDLLKSKNYKFIENIFRNKNYLIENKILQKPDKKIDEIIFENIDVSFLNIQKKDDIMDLIHIIILLYMNSITALIHNPDCKYKIKQKFIGEINLLKRVFYKKGENL
ncbi:MAG: TetR/AcrR family transcriptional regulator [bacterium]|nr:TetR/AcrR family transcriptional regulator [bacterium]